MASQIEGPVRTFIAGGALGINLRVKLDGSGKLTLAGDTDTELGTLEKEAFKDGDVVPVRLRNAQGTVKMIGNEAIAAEAEIFTAAAGKVSDTQGSGSRVGIALEAIAVDTEVFEVLRD